MIDLRLLRHFVAVAEVEHVGRAARALRISQSPLSRQLRQLEEMLGLRLFDRERQRIRLTSQGAWLLRESRHLLNQSERLERDAARIAQGQVGSIRVGFVKSAMWTSILPRALRSFRSNRPEFSIELRNARSSVQVTELVHGALDVGLVHEAPTAAGLIIVSLLKEPLLLALPKTHKLARRVGISPKDLDGADWIVLASENAKHERLLAACGRAGFVPTIRSEASDYASVLGMVEAGVGLALLPESAERVAAPNVALRRLSWLRFSRALHAVRRDATSPPLVDLVSGLKDGAAAYKASRGQRRAR